MSNQNLTWAYLLNLDLAILIHIICLNGLGIPFPLPEMLFTFSTSCHHEARQLTHFSKFSSHVASLAKCSLTPCFITYFFLCIHKTQKVLQTVHVHLLVWFYVCILLHLDRYHFIFICAYGPSDILKCIYSLHAQWILNEKQ